MKALRLALLLLGLVLGMATVSAQSIEIAPCRAYTSATTFIDAVRCTSIPVTPPDTVVTPPGEVVLAHAYGIYTPEGPNACTKAQHDAFYVDVEGKRYPTWHPPVDPSGCFYGHEHGKDPSGSHLKDVRPLAFGYANEKLAEMGGLIRHEDHVGHKVEWANDTLFTGTNPRRCDVFVRYHQGSHSHDAFTNNLHEMDYRIDCTDGHSASVDELVNIGQWGRMLEPCSTTNLVTATAIPPDGLPSGFGGSRNIATRKCVNESIVGERSFARYQILTENWAIDPSVYLANGNRLAVFATYAFVSLPARYYDTTRVNRLARTLDLCYEVDNPRDGRNQDQCRTARLAGVTDWKDERSPFKGTSRTFRFNQPSITNTSGLTVIYTDPFGKQGRGTPFPGSIAQRISLGSNGGLQVTGPGLSGNYNAPGVRGMN